MTSCAGSLITDRGIGSRRAAADHYGAQIDKRHLGETAANSAQPRLSHQNQEDLACEQIMGRRRLREALASHWDKNEIRTDIY